MSTVELSKHHTQANICDLHFQSVRNKENIKEAVFQKLENDYMCVSQDINKHLWSVKDYCL